VSYAWDNANRLIGITQGSASIPIGNDNARRRSTLTLPNGIVLAYAYDNDSRVTAMTWTLSGNTVANLQYQYDADGRVLQKSSAGSFAQSQLPSPVTANTFNAANEMTSFNGTPLTYDANGNLTNDGTDTYTWDARNHLVGITGNNTASFVYDALGRRALKSINGTTTQSLYDGLNPAQELQNGTPRANMLTGLGIDEYFQRTDSGGTYDYLSDIVGSTVALTGTSGSIQTQYTYSPFGNPSSSGSSSSNPYQFTGRENDGTGLDYYRARYYSPTTQRFISEDPLEFAGGDLDLYSYVQNSPQTLEDPTGLQIAIPVPPPPVIVCAADPLCVAVVIGGGLGAAAIYLMSRGGKQNLSNEYTDQARTKPDPCKWLAEQYANATNSVERLKIQLAQKVLGCRNKRKRCK
jgi:RHS repeat-associated protein